MNVVIIADCWDEVANLEKLLKKHHSLNRLKYFSNPWDGLEDIKTSMPDLVFIKVEMKMLHGMVLYRKITEIFKNNHKLPKVVFIGSQNNVNYAVKAYEIGALDYLVPPVSEGRINKVLANPAIRYAESPLAAEAWECE